MLILLKHWLIYIYLQLLLDHMTKFPLSIFNVCLNFYFMTYALAMLIASWADGGRNHPQAIQMLWGRSLGQNSKMLLKEMKIFVVFNCMFCGTEDTCFESSYWYFMHMPIRYCVCELGLCYFKKIISLDIVWLLLFCKTNWYLRISLQMRQ